MNEKPAYTGVLAAAGDQKQLQLLEEATIARSLQVQ